MPLKISCSVHLDLALNLDQTPLPDSPWCLRVTFVRSPRETACRGWVDQNCGEAGELPVDSPREGPMGQGLNRFKSHLGRELQMTSQIPGSIPAV